MNKKAFTLIELLAVIIVLGLILAIAIPSVFKAISQSKLDVYKTKEHQLKKAGEDYVLYNNTTLPTTLGSSININLIDLVSGKFVNPIKDLDDDSNCTGYVNITKTNTENYTYVPCIVCTNYSTTHASCE